MAAVGGRSVVVSCEHAGRSIPNGLEGILRPVLQAVAAHRVWDPGAKDIAHAIAGSFGVEVHCGVFTRLAIDLNRSLHHRALHAAAVVALPREDKQALVKGIYEPFRDSVRRDVDAATAQDGNVVHLSIHTFTPRVEGGAERNCDVAILYDPSRAVEVAIAKRWRLAFEQKMPDLRFRFNYPYRGVADGHVTALRKVYPKDRYAGLELEVNQRLVETPAFGQVCQALAKSAYAGIC